MPVPPFVRNLRVPIVKEFERLAKQNKWDELKGSEEKKLRDKYWAKRSKFIGKAVVEDFTRLYGKDKTDMEAWRRLLRDLGEKKSPLDPKDGQKVFPPGITLSTSLAHLTVSTESATYIHKHCAVQGRHGSTGIFSQRSSYPRHLQDT